MEIKDYITIFDNALPVEAVSNFIKYINAQDKKFTPARINNDGYKSKDGEGVDFDIRRTWNLSLNPGSLSLTNVHWHNVLFFLFDKCFREYSKIHSDNKKTRARYNENFFEQITDIGVLKYFEGGFFKWHTDHCYNFPRTLSAIYLLNDDYEGGELLFRTSNGSDEFQIPMGCNKVIIWPSNFLFQHTVLPVKKGIRYSVVAWAL
tara:strand:+ start:575 stop:1189 length:615 start_codon:yes stop_codon:yes gene_type:complete